MEQAQFQEMPKATLLDLEKIVSKYYYLRFWQLILVKTQERCQPECLNRFRYLTGMLNIQVSCAINGSKIPLKHSLFSMGIEQVIISMRSVQI